MFEERKTIYLCLAHMSENLVIVCLEYGINVTNDFPTTKFDACIAAVAHKKFEGLEISKLLKDKHVIFDVKRKLDCNLIDGK